MRIAASTTAEIVEELVGLVEPGVSTAELDRYAERACRARGVTPAFKGLYGFPACLCVAVNEGVVHGIPSDSCVLRAGDVLTLDFGVVYRGWYGDHARTVVVGGDARDVDVVVATERALAAGVSAAVPGGRLSDIGAAVQTVAEDAGCSVVRDFAGHGIGRRLHEDPQVLNYFEPTDRMPLREGMVICIEPMVVTGAPDVRILSDGWTAVTVDGGCAAHFEHTVAIGAGGPEILSLPGLA